MGITNSRVSPSPSIHINERKKSTSTNFDDSGLDEWLKHQQINENSFFRVMKNATMSKKVALGEAAANTAPKSGLRPVAKLTLDKESFRSSAVPVRRPRPRKPTKQELLKAQAEVAIQADSWFTAPRPNLRIVTHK